VRRRDGWLICWDAQTLGVLFHCEREGNGNPTALAALRDGSGPCVCVCVCVLRVSFFVFVSQEAAIDGPTHQRKVDPLAYAHFAPHDLQAWWWGTTGAASSSSTSSCRAP
jgi:hypothetical protein